MCLLIGTASQVSDVAHGPLIFKNFSLNKTLRKNLCIMITVLKANISWKD